MRTFRSRALAAAVLAPLLVVTACGDDDEAPADEGADDQEEPDDGEDEPAEAATLTISKNSIRGGKSTEEAEFIEDWIIPEFESRMAEEGVDVTVNFEGSGADDEDYKTALALDLSTGAGADVFAIDGIWVGEFAEAGYIQPLNQIYDGVDDWDGWSQINEAVQQNMSFNGERYGIPGGTDGRVIYFNKELFAQAGLPEDWQPTSWEELLDAGRALAELDGVIPIQLNAGTPMGEATTMQGVLPMLAGAGARIWEEDSGWQGASEPVQQVLDLYYTIYVEEGLGDPLLQQEAAGRDNSFLQFSEGQIGMLLEGDYLWRSVISPDSDLAPMENRDEVIGWAKIPAIEPGAGVDGQDFVSMSGGGGTVLNPNTEHPELAWELLTFMESEEALLERHAEQPRITARDDVNAQLIDDPLISYIAEEVLPITFYRPGFETYPQVSVALQEATAAAADGTTAADAAADYQATLEGIVGADNVAN
ncbi:MAG TPA: extracellular solute-binding protein [Jiangellaceae bacterium]